MKAIWLSGVILLGTAPWSPGADYSPYYYRDSRASTVLGSHARGAADVVRAAGQYNLSTSQAAINMTEAQNRYGYNRQLWTNTYFAMRAANRSLRAAERGPKPTMEDVVRYAQAGKPVRLSPRELDFISGHINWPLLLDTERYTQQRRALESLFSRRASAGGVSWEERIKIELVAAVMLDELKEQIAEVPPSDYMAARRFVESLAYEARMPTI